MGTKVYNDKVHLYNLNSGFWYELDSMPKPKESKGILVGNKIYLIGGFRDKPLKEIESFNLDTGEWKIEGELFDGVSKPSICHYKKKIYILESGILIIYDTFAKTLNQYSINLFLNSSSIHIHNNKIYVFGGLVENGYSKKTSRNVYSIDIDEFKRSKIIKSKKFD